MRSIKSCGLLLLATAATGFASQGGVAGSGSTQQQQQQQPFAVKFACAEAEAKAGAVGCAAGAVQLALDIFDQGAGEVGLRLSNQGPHRSTVTEVYLLDEAGLLRPETAHVDGAGLVHFRRAVKARPFPTAAGEEEAKAGGQRQRLLADLALRRRTELSRLGRMMRSNGVDNRPGDALTLTMKTTNEALDAELVADGAGECLLRLAVVVSGFEGDPKARRTFYSACNGNGSGNAK